MNSVNLIGRLTKEPEARQTAGGTTVTSFTLAIDDGYGENKKTNYIPVKVFGKTAEFCEKYLAKGRLCGVVGKIQTGSYEKNGTKVYTTDVIADKVEVLEWGDKPATKANTSHLTPVPSGFSVVDEDVPF